jgi:hypothetical protein
LREELLDAMSKSSIGVVGLPDMLHPFPGAVFTVRAVNNFGMSRVAAISQDRSAYCPLAREWVAHARVLGPS